MSRDEFERRLRDALRSDVQQASSRFTARVMDRLPRQPRRRVPMPRAALAAAGLTLAVLATVAAWHGIETAPAPTTEAQTHRELLEEYRQIEAELERVRQLADDVDPVLYLGGNENFDLVYDLESERPPARDIRPAALPDHG